MGLPYVDLKETGLNIDRLRLEKGLAIKEISETLGFSSPQAVYKWIYGQCVPSIDNLVALASILGTTIDKIIITKIA